MLQPASLEIWEARSKKRRSSNSKSSGFRQFQSVVYLITRLSKIVFVDWFWITFFLSVKNHFFPVESNVFIQFWIQTHEIFLRIPDLKRMRVLTTRQWIRHSMRKFWITCLEWVESFFKKASWWFAWERTGFLFFFSWGAVLHRAASGERQIKAVKRSSNDQQLKIGWLLIGRLSCRLVKNSFVDLFWIIVFFLIRIWYLFQLFRACTEFDGWFAIRVYIIMQCMSCSLRNAGIFVPVIWQLNNEYIFC